MPDILTMNDSAELLNRFKSKYILYVEGPSDRTAYRRLVGDRFLIDYDFTTPPAGNGANAVRKRVREEREKSNKVFGFLDGEAAATLGAATTLVECDNLLFRVDRDDLDGLIFIAAHELENLILSYCDVAPTIADYGTMTRLKEGEAGAVRERLKNLTSRFLASAMFKYASLHFQHRGACIHVANTQIFTQNAGLRATLNAMKVVVTKQLKLNWNDFLNELFAITRAMRQRVAAAPPPSLQKPLRHLRLADGKQLMSGVRGSASKDVEGHLLSVLAKTDFVDDFRAAIKAEVALAA